MVMSFYKHDGPWGGSSSSLHTGGNFDAKCQTKLVCLLSAVNGCFTPLKLTAGTWKWVPPWKGDSYCKPSFLPAILVLGPGTVVSGWFHPPNTPWFFFWQQESATYQSMCQGGHRAVDASEDLVTFLEMNSWWLEDEFPFGARAIFRGFYAAISPKNEMIQNGDISLSWLFQCSGLGYHYSWKTYFLQCCIIFDCLAIFFWSKDGLETYIKDHIPFPFCFVHEVIFFKIIPWHTGQSC